MNTSDNSENRQDPLHDPSSANINKSTAKPKPKKSKTPMLNQAWVDETVRAFGLAAGPVATRVGQELSTSLEAKLIKAASREKIAKLIRAAFAKSIGNDLS